MNKQLVITLSVIAAIVVLSIAFVPKNESENNKEVDPLSLVVPEDNALRGQQKEEENMKMAKSYDAPPSMQIDINKKYTAVLKTSAGEMKIKLFTAETPKTANNFIFLAKEKFYENTIFHRVISNFMIQGGDPKGNGTGDPGYKFNDEAITRDYTRGTVAMANSGPNTNGSQFFIMTKDTALPKNYVIFGFLEGEESLKTLDIIAQSPVTQNSSGERSKPAKPTTINSVEIIEEDAIDQSSTPKPEENLQL